MRMFLIGTTLWRIHLFGNFVLSCPHGIISLQLSLSPYRCWFQWLISRGMSSRKTNIIAKSSRLNSRFFFCGVSEFFNSNLQMILSIKGMFFTEIPHRRRIIRWLFPTTMVECLESTHNICARDGLHMPNNYTGISLCMRPSNERRRYIVTSSLIGWAFTQMIPDVAVPCRQCAHDAIITSSLRPNDVADVVLT